MLREAEPRRVSRSSLELLRDVGELIEPDDPDLREWFSSYRDEHHRRLATDVDLVRRFSQPGMRLLEWGAIPLLATAALSKLDYRVHALDLAPERFSRAIERLGLSVRRCDVERDAVPHETASFDMALFNELFEHLRIDPIFTMSEVYRVLRPGGKLLLSTPNLRSFRGLRNLLWRDMAYASSEGVYAQYEKLHRLGHMGHVREYTVTEVGDFLRSVGFAVERVVFRGGHGAGLVGLAERVAPSFRPFFTLVASRSEAPKGESG